jgi:iron complex outermembrane receptor protein
MSGLPNNSNYLDFFPHALLTYKYNNKNDFSLSYSHGIDRPGYEDVNPFLYYVDPYSYRSGNPKLKPQYSNTIEFSYSYNKTLVATLYSNIVDGAYHLPFFQQNDVTKKNVNIPTNLGTVYNYGLKFFTPFVVAKWWSGNFNIDAGYQRYVAYPENGNLNKGTQDILLSTEHKFVIGNGLLAELSGKYESPTFYGISQYKAQFQVDGGLSQQLFNKRGSLKLGITDIFNTLRDRSHTTYQNLDIYITDKKESQIIRLAFSYRFGKTTVKTVRVHNTGNDDEQSRTKSSVLPQ